MTPTNARFLFGAIPFACALGSPPVAHAACEADVDCPIDLVCVAGACTTDPAAPPPAPPQAVPAPAAAPPSPAPAALAPSDAAPPSRAAHAPADSPPPDSPPPDCPPPGLLPPRYFSHRAIDDWEEGDPVPTGYRSVSVVRRGMAIAGGSIFGAAYVAGTVGASTCGDSCRALFAPLVGPFITAATFDDGDAVVTPLLMLDGLAQVGGAVLFITGLATETKELRRRYGGVELELAPAVGLDGGSLGVVGRF